MALNHQVSTQKETWYWVEISKKIFKKLIASGELIYQSK